MKRPLLAALCLAAAMLLIPYSPPSKVSRETTTTVTQATSTTPAATTTRPTRATPAPKPRTPRAAKPLDAAQIATKQAVAAQFDTHPAMVAVVACESHYSQFCSPQVDGMGQCSPAHYGEPLMSRTADVGVAQINVPTWGARAKAEGLDIFNSEADNLKMAQIVLQEQGITAWTCYAKTR